VLITLVAVVWTDTLIHPYIVFNIACPLSDYSKLLLNVAFLITLMISAMKASGICNFLAVWALWWRTSCPDVAVHALGYTASAEVCDGHDDTHEDMMRHHRYPTRILDEDQLSSYRDDGFIVLRGVLNDDLVHRMGAAGHAIVNRASKFPQFFSVVETGLIFNGGGMREEKDPETASVFREVALNSDLPQIAAELMDLDRDTQNLRVLRYVSSFFMRIIIIIIISGGGGRRNV
jgi:hypothetical protein